LSFPQPSGSAESWVSIPAELRVKVWKQARRLAEKQGQQPDGRCVKEAPAHVIGSPEIKERQARELVQKFESVARSLQVGLAPDSLSENERARLKATLDSIGNAVLALQKQL
jgi:hypothetical protein